MRRALALAMLAEALCTLQSLVLLGAYLSHHANAQPGFTSLVCGPNYSRYTSNNGILWTSDADYAPPSQTFSIKSHLQHSLQTLRSFPPDVSSPSGRSCYRLLVTPGLSLVRATFTYSNYDSFNQPPMFGVAIGPTLYTAVDLALRDPWVEEIILNATEPQAFCLIAMTGTPVISLLELRRLPLGAYSHASPILGVLLRKIYRLDCGSDSQTTTRYPDDLYDRIWDPDQYYIDASSTSTHSIMHALNTSGVADDAPMNVLQSVRFNFYNSSLTYSLPLPERNGKYLMNTYFGELYNTTGPSFRVLVNGVFLLSIYGWPPLSGLEYTALQPAIAWWNLTLEPVSDAPQINGLELYETVELHQSTYQPDLRELNRIEVNYNLQSLQLDWVPGSDPCFPVPWRGIICNTLGAITSLDLSNMGLLGDIRGIFGDLTSLESLNASTNNLIGQIPDLTGHLRNLKILDLSNNDIYGTLNAVASLGLNYLNVANNRLSGAIPKQLNRPSLVLITSGNRCIEDYASCTATPGTPHDRDPISAGFNTPTTAHHTHRHSRGPVIAGSVVGATLAALAIATLGIIRLRHHKLERELMVASEEAANIKTIDRELTQFSSSTRRFSFKDLEAATNHFKDVIGEGSFGPVYRGRFSDGSSVAIKVRSDASLLDADSFLNEAMLLSRVRHKNLVFLKGFCQESKKQFLVFEFMSGGTLMDHLYGSISKVHPMTWKQRLFAVIGAATGIEHLHYGDPKIVHRNVKSSNILLGANYIAKVSDFGLMRVIKDAESTPVATLIKGTAGYLDPEYFTTQQLTEKSDVFSFGVVLMEVLCGREPLSSSCDPDAYNLVAWVRPALRDGLPQGNLFVLDKLLQNQFKIKSLAIVAEIALQCTEQDSVKRPTMTDVVRELTRAWEVEEAVSCIVPQSPHRALQPMNKKINKERGTHYAADDPCLHPEHKVHRQPSSYVML